MLKTELNRTGLHSYLTFFRNTSWLPEEVVETHNEIRGSALPVKLQSFHPEVDMLVVRKVLVELLPVEFMKAISPHRESLNVAVREARKPFSDAPDLLPLPMTSFLLLDPYLMTMLL